MGKSFYYCLPSTDISLPLARVATEWASPSMMRMRKRKHTL